MPHNNDNLKRENALLREEYAKALQAIENAKKIINSLVKRERQPEYSRNNPKYY